MGAYIKEKLGNDFKISMRGEAHIILTEIELIAFDVLHAIPDNECRDMAISHLLQATQFIALSLIKRRLEGK